MSETTRLGQQAPPSARSAALAALSRYPPPASAVVRYPVQGSLLIAGDTDPVLAAADRLAHRHRIVALVSGAMPSARPTRFALIPGRVRRIEGWLGQFRAYAEGPAGTLLDLGPLSPRADARFDRVLDLNVRPLLKREVPPLGYFWAGTHPQSLARALSELEAEPGPPEKPRYFRFEPSLCVHQAKGVPGCHRCLEVCPADALGDSGMHISAEPFLCQGCGTCTLVCPTGALSYAYPGRESVTADLARALVAYHSRGASGPLLLLYDGDASLPLEELPERVVPLRVHALAGIGMEVWLTALAWGWGGVLLLPKEATPPRSRRALEDQVALARSFLAGSGRDTALLQIVAGLQDLAPCPAAPSAPAAVSEPPPAKRATLLAALDALSDTRAPGDAAVPLPSGAFFGTVRVDPDRCTHCLACVGLCPTGALRGEVRQLRFLEAACVQCGLCAAGCPEDAVTLEPRLALNTASRNQPRVLAEADMFHCVSCGEPFAPAALVRSAGERVKTLEVFAGNGRRLLEMCPRCRMREMMGGPSGSPS